MSYKQEWDWTPERRRRRRYDSPDVFPPATSIMASPTMTRVANGYLKAGWTMVKMVLGGICGLALFGCVWLIMKILSLS
jgi:hypothetical protein